MHSFKFSSLLLDLRDVCKSSSSDVESRSLGDSTGMHALCLQDLYSSYASSYGKVVRVYVLSKDILRIMSRCWFFSLFLLLVLIKLCWLKHLSHSHVLGMKERYTPASKCILGKFQSSFVMRILNAYERINMQEIVLSTFERGYL